MDTIYLHKRDCPTGRVRQSLTKQVDLTQELSPIYFPFPNIPSSCRLARSLLGSCSVSDRFHYESISSLYKGRLRTSKLCFKSALDCPPANYSAYPTLFRLNANIPTNVSIAFNSSRSWENTYPLNHVAE